MGNLFSKLTRSSVQLSLIVGALTLGSLARADELSVSYATPEQIIYKAQSAAQMARERAYGLSGYQLQEVDQALNQAMAALSQNGGGGGYPPPYGPACDVLGSGYYNGITYNYRISVNGTVMVGSDSLDTMLTKLRELENARVCFVQQKSCSIGGKGYYSGISWNYQLKLNQSSIYASDSFENLRSALNRLQSARVCRLVAQGACQLMGPGNYGGISWNHRIAIGNEVIMASDNLETSLSNMNMLRQGGFCY